MSGVLLSWWRRVYELLPKAGLLIAFIFVLAGCSGANISPDELISSAELGEGTALEDDLLDQYISGWATGPCGGAVAWNVESPVGRSFETEIGGQRAIVVHIVALAEDAPAVVAALASDLGDGCSTEVEVVGDPGDTEIDITKLNSGGLAGTAWTVAVNANGMVSYGASYYVAYGDTRLSAVEISSFEPLSEDDVLKIFALAVAEELEGE